MNIMATAIKPASGLVRPNLADYATAVAEFSWAAARRELDGLETAFPDVKQGS